MAHNHYTLANAQADKLAEQIGREAAASFLEAARDLIKHRTYRYGRQEIGIHEGMRFFRLGKSKRKKRVA
jgi:hypothetical protein